MSGDNINNRIDLFCTKLDNALTSAKSENMVLSLIIIFLAVVIMFMIYYFKNKSHTEIKIIDPLNVTLDEKVTKDLADGDLLKYYN